MTVKLEYKNLVKYLKDDKEQLTSLKILSQKREIPLKSLVRRGIFAVPDKDELDYLLEAWGLSFEEAFGKEVSDLRLLNEGFIIPVLDSRYRIQFFVNYNWERGGARKYLNVYPNEFMGLTMNLKMFGAHNLTKGIKDNWIVVVEGMFDVIRLEGEDIPVLALMGTKLLDYHKRFLNRFDRVVYVSDADSSGRRGWENVNRGLSNAVHYPLTGLTKDVDEFAVKEKQNYRLWLRGLKEYRGNNAF